MIPVRDKKELSTLWAQNNLKLIVKLSAQVNWKKAMYPLWVVSMGSGEHPLQ